jgi:hypothetical protein
MAEITRTRDHDPYGDLEYCVEWTDNDGIGRERYFKSFRAAEKYALKIETELLDEAVRDFSDCFSSLPPEGAQQFQAKLKLRL